MPEPAAVNCAPKCLRTCNADVVPREIQPADRHIGSQSICERLCTGIARVVLPQVERLDRRIGPQYVCERISWLCVLVVVVASS